jgi:YidC/Oxa1 family membrane protein insertase
LQIFRFLQQLLVDFFQIIYNLLYAIIPNPNVVYGLAIILFTLIIRILLLPLNIKQTKSQAKMQEIQPEIQKIQTKYKNDPQKSQQEVMKLYKEHNANPLSGCLPLLIQFPILIAMFHVFRNLDLEGIRFLWLNDLSQRDQTYILPILSAATTYFSSLLMAPKTQNPQSKQTSTMNTGMAIFMGVMSINFESALVLYWVINNLLQIAQTYIMKKAGLIGTPAVEDKNEAVKGAKVIDSDKMAAKEVSTDKETKNKKKSKKD